MTDREVMQQALEALKGVLDDNPKVLEASISGGLYEVVQCRDAITALRTALEQSEQEPWGWYSAKADDFMSHSIRKEHERLGSHTHINGKFDLALYTAPPQRPWVGLTDDDMKDPKTHNFDFIYGARWAESKLKERNK